MRGKEDLLPTHIDITGDLEFLGRFHSIIVLSLGIVKRISSGFDHTAIG